MKKILVSFILIFSIFLQPVSMFLQSPESVEASSNSIGTGVVNTNSGELNVRNSNSSSSKKIGSLAKGSNVVILQESKGWYKINYGNSTGWVLGTYIIFTPASTIQSNKDYIDYVNFNIDGKNLNISSILREGSTYINIRELIQYFPTTHLYYADNVIFLQIDKNGIKRNVSIDLNQANKGNQYLAIEQILTKKDKKKNPSNTNMIPVNDGKNKNNKKPIIYNGRTYVNINDINKIFSTTAKWNESTRTVYITYMGQSLTYKNTKTNKTYVFLNDQDLRKMHNDFSSKKKTDTNLFTAANLGIETGKVIFNTAIGNPAAKITFFTVSRGLAGAMTPSTTETVGKIFINYKHRQYQALDDLLGTLEYQGRGAYYEVKITKNKKGESQMEFVGNIKQQ